MIRTVTVGLWLMLTGLLRPGLAQELPPPGGWPLRPVTELAVVPEPPGGLVPYRQGQLWGYADTTGRVWIRPQFAHEPPLFGQGLLLRTGEGPWPKWHARYGMVWWEAYPGPKGMRWTLGHGPKQPAPTDRSFLLNAHGEQLVAEPEQALMLDVTGRYRAVRRDAHFGRPELLVIRPRQRAADPNPGAWFTRPISAQSLLVPKRLNKPRRFGLGEILTDQEPFRFSASKVNWLRPTYRAWFQGHCGDRGQRVVRRYRHQGRDALFDERGRRLTPYRYHIIQPLQPRLLLYQDADHIADIYAYRQAGLPASAWPNGTQWGLLTANGQPLTPADFFHIWPLGHGTFWVVAQRQGTLHYGIIDTLGRFRVPLAAEPLSLADDAGLLRRRSAPPVPSEQNAAFKVRATYPDTATISYLRPDGRPAFPGRFEQASAFWRGRALVRQHGHYGIIDTLGRWVLPPQPGELSYYYRSGQSDAEDADPLLLFDEFDRDNPFTQAATDSTLLLLHRDGAYGLVEGRSGRLLIAPCFDEEPKRWRGALSGRQQGRPLVVTSTGQAFRPNEGQPLPAGVEPYDWRAQVEAQRNAWWLEHTPQGYRTRGGRQLWAD